MVPMVFKNECRYTHPCQVSKRASRSGSPRGNDGQSRMASPRSPLNEPSETRIPNLFDLTPAIRR